LIMFWMQCHI